MKPLCRCGREDWQHQPLPVNSYSPPCNAYDPMDFGPFEDQITDCCCTLHTELAYAVSRRARRYVWAPLSSALYDALRAGSHEYVSRKGRVDKLKSPDMEAAS